MGIRESWHDLRPRFSDDHVEYTLGYIDSDWPERYASNLYRMSPQGLALPGWQRTDTHIREDICERMAAEGLDVSTIEVTVQNGEVTLEGYVAKRRDKRRLEKLLERVPGICDVDNRLALVRDTWPETSLEPDSI